MPDLFTSLLRSLGDVSGWVAFAALALAMLFGLIRGLIVPGYLYEREVRRGDRAEDAVDAATKTTEQAAAATRMATETAISVATQFSRLSDMVTRVRREPD